MRRAADFFWFAVGNRKFWVGDAATVRDPNLIMGIVFGCGRLEIVSAARHPWHARTVAGWL